jgi:hypothetical protein
MEGERIMGRLQARMSASGARSDVGTMVLVREQQAAEIEFGTEITAYTGAKRAEQFRFEKTGRLMQADIHKQTARQVWSEGKRKAFGYVLGGTSTMLDNRYE